MVFQGTRARVFTVFTLVFLGGCAHQYEVRPTDDERYWGHGREYGVARTSGFEMHAARTDASLFHVIVENVGDSSVEVSAVDFRLEGPALDDGAVAAIDPEAQLRELSAHMEANAPSTWDVAVSLLDATSAMADAVSSVAGDTSREAARTRAYRADERRSREEERESRAARYEWARQAKRELESSRLRRTTLVPGGRIEGLVDFGASYRDGPLALTLSKPPDRVSVRFAVSRVP